jgi:hypothetical protein
MGTERNAAPSSAGSIPAPARLRRIAAGMRRPLGWDCSHRDDHLHRSEALRRDRSQARGDGFTALGYGVHRAICPCRPGSLTVSQTGCWGTSHHSDPDAPAGTGGGLAADRLRSGGIAVYWFGAAWFIGALGRERGRVYRCRWTKTRSVRENFDQATVRLSSTRYSRRRSARPGYQLLAR